MKSLVRLDLYSQTEYSRGKSGFVVLLWWFIQGTIFRFSFHNMYGWRNFILRLFGAKIGTQVKIRSSARFTYPWKVKIGNYSWVGDRVELYSLDYITIGNHCVISQDSYLCTGGHKVDDPTFGLITSPILIKDGAWVASDVFVSAGITIHEMGVVGARSNVIQDVAANKIHVGNPARYLKDRFTEEVKQ